MKQLGISFLSFTIQNGTYSLLMKTIVLSDRKLQLSLLQDLVKSKQTTRAKRKWTSPLVLSNCLLWFQLKYLKKSMKFPSSLKKITNWLRKKTQKNHMYKCLLQLPIWEQFSKSKKCSQTYRQKKLKTLKNHQWQR